MRVRWAALVREQSWDLARRLLDVVAVGELRRRPETQLALCRRVMQATRARRRRDEEYCWLAAARGAIRALSSLGRFEEAWRAHLRVERAIWGEVLYRRRSRWDTWKGPYHYSAELADGVVPLLYFRGRFNDARRALEWVLAWSLQRGGWRVVEMHLWSPRPAHPEPYGVTLGHVYDALGLTLEQWSDWQRFVGRLPAGWFREAGVTRKTLGASASLFPTVRGAGHRLERARSGYEGPPPPGPRDMEWVRWIGENATRYLGVELRRRDG